MTVKDDLGQYVVDEIGGRILHHGDLFQHDFALAVEVCESGREQHVGHDVERKPKLVVQETAVDHDVFTRRACVELPAKGVENLGDLLRRVLRRALEQEMLYEVAGPDQRRGFIPRAGGDPETQTHRPQVLELLGDEPLAVGQGLQPILVSRHCLPSGRCSRADGG